MAKKTISTQRTVTTAVTTANTGERKYTIGYVPNGGKRPPSPAINLGGKWLAECGFTTGQTVCVAISPGRLIVDLIKPH